MLILPILSFLFGGVDASVEIPVIKQLSQSSFTYEGGIKLTSRVNSFSISFIIVYSNFYCRMCKSRCSRCKQRSKEAAASIGLTPNQVSKISCYASSFKNNNSTNYKSIFKFNKKFFIAAAIAYPDLVLVFAGTALMQTGRAIEIVSITMLTYLTLSISISILMNWYNKKIAIKEK